MRADGGLAAYHSEQEVEQAALALRPPDLKRLHAAARAVLRVFGLETADRDHEDLLSEALTRTLSGSRRWKRGVDFVRHLGETLRSVAWTWRERQEVRTRAGLSRSDESAAPADGDVDEHPDVFGRPAPDVEGALLAEERVLLIRRHFAGDRGALAVMDAWADGYKAREVRQLTGLSDREYDAAARRIRRFAQRRGSDAPRSAERRA